MRLSDSVRLVRCPTLRYITMIVIRAYTSRYVNIPNKMAPIDYQWRAPVTAHLQLFFTSG